MKRLMLATALSAFAFVAAAQTPNPQAPVEPAAQPAAQVNAPADASADAQAQPAKKKLSDARCLRQTGSRIQSKSKQDCAAYGRSYSRDDLNGTGEVDVASALRKLDPAVH
ncbi:hypothetical protein IEQ11_17590 [Lysobacter capsici]|uniref:Secreted protein n=1 Tax=Lysobacter capsici AZ78 TaxID=1444315 RepID=A0A108UDA7_9GAMM|nr:hypothetical protein [Lysobacter capsici]KWS07134.1 hypothetical protein AZ78_4694 [Lysobacter capsici AZ78]UOF13546.1 hypothetical protein IEQ11_17590 [Lysobacter capsici]